MKELVKNILRSLVLTIVIVGMLFAFALLIVTFTPVSLLVISVLTLVFMIYLLTDEV